MAIITLANQKGGVGKTSLSMALYFAFLKSNVKTLLIDYDPQQSIQMLNLQIDANWNVISKLDTKTIKAHTITIIDTKPEYSQALPAIKLANIVLMPFRPSQFDVIATVQTAKAIVKDSPKTKVVAVMNCNIPNTDYPAKARQTLKDAGIETLSITIGNRLDFARTFDFEGNIYKSKNTKAKSEIDALALEIYGKLI